MPCTTEVLKQRADAHRGSDKEAPGPWVPAGQTLLRVPCELLTSHEGQPQPGWSTVLKIPGVKVTGAGRGPRPRLDRPADPTVLHPVGPSQAGGGLALVSHGLSGTLTALSTRCPFP